MIRKNSIKRGLKKRSEEYVCLLTMNENEYYKIVNIKKITDIKLISPNNRLLNIDQTSKVWTGRYNNVEYILGTSTKINNERIVLNRENTTVKKGIKLQLKGRLKGATKSSTFKDSLGQVRTHTFGKEIDYCSKAIQTKWGKFGLKVFLSN